MHAADDTQFNLAYARIGASPDAGSTWSLPRVVGTRKALELGLLAESFGRDHGLCRRTGCFYEKRRPVFSGA